MGDWKSRPEGGGRLALGLLVRIARHGGRGIARALLFPIALYFICVRGPERRASADYLRRALGREPSLRDGVRHVHTFAATILDRVFLLGGRLRDFDVAIRGLPDLHAALDQGRGVLLFGSHLGSFEVLRVLARERPDYTIRVVLDRQMSPALNALLDELNPEIAAGVIDASQDGPTITMAIAQACGEGALVALLVDRMRGDEPSLPAPFLGSDAPFPTAPWLIAAALKVPVVLGFGLYHGGNRYELVFEPFEDVVVVPRGQRVAATAALIRRYASRLETFARSAPYNWFNFYDFWQLPPHRAGATPQADTPAVADTVTGSHALDSAVVDDAAVQRRTAVRHRAAGGSRTER